MQEKNCKLFFALEQYQEQGWNNTCCFFMFGYIGFIMPLLLPFGMSVTGLCPSQVVQKGGIEVEE